MPAGVISAGAGIAGHDDRICPDRDAREGNDAPIRGHPQLIQQPSGVSSGHGDIDVVGIGDANSGVLQQGQPRQRVEQEVAVVHGGVVGTQRDQGASHPLDLGSACPVRKALGATTPEGGVLEQHAIPG